MVKAGVLSCVGHSLNGEFSTAKSHPNGYFTGIYCVWFWFNKAAEDVSDLSDLGAEQQQREPPQTVGAL